MTTLTEGFHDGEFIVAELPGMLSRKAGTLNSGQADLAAGTVLGQILSAGAATFVGTVGTRGAVTVSAAIGSKTVAGIYKIVCVAAASDAGTFNLYAPDGTLVRQITVGGGSTASDHLTLTIADGATDFSVGDTYTITVTAGDYEQLDTAATTGEQIAAAILFGAVDATSADKPCVVVYKTAAVNTDEITWPVGISDANKAIATATLAAAGIVLR